MSPAPPTVDALADALAARRSDAAAPGELKRLLDAAAAALDACAKHGWFVQLGASGPRHAPRVLFVRGTTDWRGPDTCVAVVGSREAPPAALAWARACAEALVRAGACVVSGLARGVDAAAHRAALDAGGRTVAVLAHGLDRVYPPEHAGLADAIVAGGGALVTEYPPGTPPERWRFAARDRAQVALCRAVIAVYSEPEGGTMHTVAHAARTGVHVLVPRDIPIGAGLAAAVREGHALEVTDADAAVREALRPSLPVGALFRT
jgi:DNA processing protein